MTNKLEKKLLHYCGKAIADYALIRTGDRVMVCLSGGKDSYTLLNLLRLLRQRARNKFDLFAYTLDQSQPGWDDSGLRAWLRDHDIPHEIEKRDTYSIVIDKIPAGKTYCALCSRLRRGNIYRYAAQHGYTKIALGHHRDDLIASLLLSIFYQGQISAMPPKLKTDDGKHIVIRPLAYCQEQDIATYAIQQGFPIIPCNLCGSQENLARRRVRALIDQLAAENPKVPSNILHALAHVNPSQLMDTRWWNLRGLDQPAAATGNPPSEDMNSIHDFLENYEDTDESVAEKTVRFFK